MYELRATSRVAFIASVVEGGSGLLSRCNRGYVECRQTNSGAQTSSVALHDLGGGGGGGG